MATKPGLRNRNTGGYKTLDLLDQLEEESKQREEREWQRQEHQYQDRLRQYGQFQAERNAEIAKGIKMVSPLEIANRAQQERVEERRRAVNTGGNVLTPEIEAEYQRRNGGGNSLSPYQAYMQAQMAQLPKVTAPAETRSTDELRRDMNRKNRIAGGTERMAADMSQGLQNRLYDPTYTTNLQSIQRQAEASRASADRAANLYQTLSTQRRLEEEQAKVAEMMKNPDFRKNSQGSQAVADSGMATATGSNPTARLYRDIYYRGTAGLDGKGQTDSAARNVTDDEASVFFYLWNTQGAKAAEKYYKDYVENRASQRQMETIQRQAQAYGEYDPLGASVASEGTNIMSGVGLIDMAWQNLARSVGITDKNKPLNYYSPAQSFGLKTDAYRQGASNFLEQSAADELRRNFPGLKNPEKYAGVASFLYQTGMSMADSGVSALLTSIGVPEPLTLANMGAAAGTRAIRDAKERGATDGQALAFGVSSAIMEALFEKISMDKILEPSYADTFKAHLWNAVSQSFTEGSEEVMTTLANTAMDQLIMGDKSELFARQRELMERGVGEKEALGAAFKQWGTEVLGDFLGGLVSGFGMGGIKEAGYAVGALRNSADNALLDVDLQNMAAASRQEARLRQQYEQQQNAPQPQPLTIPSQETMSARTADPLGYAMDKARQGETVNKSDARAILENPQALQALRDTGALTGKVANDSEGRQKIIDAVSSLAEQRAQDVSMPAAETQQTVATEAERANPYDDLLSQIWGEQAQERTAPATAAETRTETNDPAWDRIVADLEAQRARAAEQRAQERTQREEEVSTPPVPRAQETTSEASTEGKLRLPEQKQRQEAPPVPRLTLRSENATLNENRQEVTNGQAETAASAEAERARNETAAFRRAANDAAGGADLDRVEWRAGLGRLLQAVRNSRDAGARQQRRSEAARITDQAEAGNPERLSARDLGVADGTDEKTAVRVNDKILGSQWQQTVADYAKRGIKLTAISGQMQLDKRRPDGSNVQARAYISADGKNIVVQADNPRLSWQQLLAHEELHRLIKEDSGYRKRVMDALLADKKVRPYLSQVIDRYAEAYHSVDPTATDEDIIEELLADYRAGFDMLDPLGTNRTLAKVTKAAAKDIRAVEKTPRKQYETNGGKPAPADIEENFAEAKNSVEPPYRLGTKAAQTFEDGLNEQARSVYDMFLDVRNASLENTAVMTVGAGKKAHPKRVTIADRFLTAADWNDQVKSDPEFAQAAKNIFSVIPADIRKNARLNDDGTISETEFEKRFKMARSLVQRLVDALPKGVVGSTVELDGKSIQVARGRVTASVGGEEYRRALIAEKRRLYEEGSLPTRAIGTLSHDNWGAMGFLATNTKTIASGDFTTFCPQMYFNDGCWYCYRRAALTSGVNNKLTAETVWYAGEILQLRQADIDRLNQVGGLRIQSFGDWMTQYSTMLADMLIDAEKVGLQIKVITKEPSMIDTVALLKEQGLGKSLYFNLSADYTIEKRGKVDNTNTSDALPMNPERPFMRRENESGEEETWWKRALTVQEANEYRKMYPWVNTRIVATNLDEFIRGLSDPTVDVVTGYHGDIRQQERVSSETGETLLDVEPLGDAGMPRFAYARKTGEWTLEYEGKSRYQKQLAQRIQEEGLEREYYTKSCCIFGRCAKCQGKCGSYARSFAVKNATNRDQESVKYWQREMESGVDNPLLESQQEGKASTEIDTDDIGTTLKTAKGSPIKRAGKYGVGKEIGGRVYLHKQYAEDVIPADEYERAQQIVAEEYPDFTYNCVEYEPKTGTIRFDEAPGFDTEREPAVGDYVEVKADGSTRKGHTDYIWHHKWLWVKNDYQGFDVAESWNWSKKWLSTITGKTYEVNGKPYNDNGKSDGNGIGRWNAQLDAYGLPRDQRGKDKYSLTVVPEVTPSSDSWTRGHSEAWFIQHGYPIYRDVSADQAEANEETNQDKRDGQHGTQIKTTLSTYVKVFDRIKEEHPDNWQDLRILDASSGLGLGTRVGREMGFNVTDIEPYPSKTKYQFDNKQDDPDTWEVRHPDYEDYSALEKLVASGEVEGYDYIISNAVLNVIPQDTRDNLVVAMGHLLKPGGQMFVNVINKDYQGALDSKPEIQRNAKGVPIGYVRTAEGDYSQGGNVNGRGHETFVWKTNTVQKVFSYNELVAYLRDALGDGYTVQPFTKFGMTAAMVTKDMSGSASIEIDPEVAAQFSPEALADKEVRALIRENEDLKKKLKYWKAQTKTSDRTQPRAEDVRRMAKNLLSEFDSKADGENVTDALGELAHTIMGNDSRWSDIQDQARRLAGRIIESSALLGQNETGELGYSSTVAEATQILANDIIDAIMDDVIRRTPTTYADRAEARVEREALKGDRRVQATKERLEAKADARVAREREKGDLKAQRVQERADERLIREQEKWEQRTQRLQERADNRLAREVEKSERRVQKVKDLLAAEKERRREQVAKVKEHYKAKETKGREDRAAQKMRAKIEKHAKQMLATLEHPTDKKHIPDSLLQSVKTVLAAIDLGSGYDTMTGADGKTLRVGRGTEGAEQTKRTKAFLAVRDALMRESDGLVLDPELLGTVEEPGNLIRLVTELADIPIASMNTEQLKVVYDALRGIEGAVKSANRMLSQARWAAVSEAADAIRGENGGKQAPLQLAGAAGRMQDLTRLDMLTPEGYFHRLGKSGQAVFKMLRGAQDQFITNMAKATTDTQKIVGDTDVRALEKEKHTVTLGGEKTTMTTAQIMELYCLMQRDQGLQHITTGGILIEPIRQGVTKTTQVEPVHPSMEELLDAVRLLTPDEIRMADALQDYLSKDMAELGNEATLAVYGYKKFGQEEKYWKIRSNKNETPQSIEKETQTTSVANRGFTKAINPNADTSIKIGSIFDTYSQSINDMATYAAWLAVGEDVNRIRNFIFRDADGQRTGTVKGILDRVIGSGGAEYLQRLMADIANGAGMDDAGLTSGFVGAYKAAAIGANIRVIIQQPTAILRAAEMIDPKYLAEGLKSPMQAFERAKKYSPIAQWKDWGYFDINTGRKMKDVLFENSSKLEQVRQASMALAGKADSFAWGQLWGAVEAETKAKGLKPGTKEFYDACAERFNAIIDHTQVVDGILQRSQIMRSKNAITRMAVSFMSEPTKQYNQFMSAVYDYRHSGDKTQAKQALARTTFSMLAAGVMNVLAQSIVDALRNGDREKKYWEKLLQAFLGYDPDDDTFGDKFKTFAFSNMGEFINPASYLPYAKDIMSIIQGYSVERMDMDGLSDTITAITRLAKAINGEGKQTVAYSLGKAVEQGAKLLGLSAYNVDRDLTALITTIANDADMPVLQYYLNRYRYKPGDNLSKDLQGILWDARQKNDGSYDIIVGHLLKDGYTQEQIDKVVVQKVSDESGFTDARKAADAEGNNNGSYDLQETLEALGNATLTEEDRDTLLEAKLSDKQYGNYTTLLGYVDYDTWLSVMREMPSSLSQAKIEAVLDKRDDLTTNQKAAFWQVLSGSTSTKNNPYSQEIGEEILDAKAENQPDKEPEKVAQMRSTLSGLGLQDSKVDALAPVLGGDGSNTSKWRAVANQNLGKDQQDAVLASIMTDAMYRNWTIASGENISLDSYVKGREAYVDLDNSGTDQNSEWTAALEKVTFDKDASRNNYIKGVLWQIYTGSTSTKNNPFDKTGGQAVLDAKSKGGGKGSGSYAPARIPTLRLPAIPEVEKPSSGLRIIARPQQEAARPSGLRITARAK